MLDPAWRLLSASCQLSSSTVSSMTRILHHERCSPAPSTRSAFPSLIVLFVPSNTRLCTTGSRLLAPSVDPYDQLVSSFPLLRVRLSHHSPRYPLLHPFASNDVCARCQWRIFRVLRLACVPHVYAVHPYL